MRPSFRSLIPDCRSPNTSPEPRISRSFSASRKPSVDAAIASMRASPSAVVGSANEEAPRRVAAAPDAAAELVELREAEAVGVLDDHHRRVRHVDADLDHGRGDEHVELAGAERGHHRLPSPSTAAGRAAARAAGRASSSACRRSNSAVAALASTLPLSSTSGHTT